MWSAENLPALALGAAAIGGLVALLAEWIHSRRIRRVGPLAFGPQGRPRPWTKLVPLLRIASIAAAVWSMVMIVSFDDRTREERKGNNTIKHLVVLLDVSPSMLLDDAGPSADLTRKARAAEVLKDILDQAPGEHLRFTAVGFYTEARMLVERCEDRELLMHLASETPLHVTYKAGKTDVLGSVNQTAKMIGDLPRKSATLLIISDGDSLPPSGLKPLPPAVSKVVIAGVGDTARGSFIDGHQSRQDTSAMSQLARRLGGEFFDCNQRNLPAEAVDSLNEDDSSQSRWKVDQRIGILLLLASSITTLCALPLLLDLFGSPWRHRTTPHPA